MEISNTFACLFSESSIDSLTHTHILTHNLSPSLAARPQYRRQQNPVLGIRRSSSACHVRQNSHEAIRAATPSYVPCPPPSHSLPLASLPCHGHGLRVTGGWLAGSKSMCICCMYVGEVRPRCLSAVVAREHRAGKKVICGVCIVSSRATASPKKSEAGRLQLASCHMSCLRLGVSCMKPFAHSRRRHRPDHNSLCINSD